MSAVDNERYVVRAEQTLGIPPKVVGYAVFDRASSFRFVAAFHTRHCADRAADTLNSLTTEDEARA